MDEQTARERLSENESLTDGLDDDEASLLLDWGYRQIPGLFRLAGDDTAAGQKLQALMNVMRQITLLITSRLERPAAEWIAELKNLTALYTQTYGAARPFALAEAQALAQEIRRVSGPEAISRLLDWVKPA